jgi:hypothetical protein
MARREARARRIVSHAPLVHTVSSTTVYREPVLKVTFAPKKHLSPHHAGREPIIPTTERVNLLIVSNVQKAHGATFVESLTMKTTSVQLATTAKMRSCYSIQSHAQKEHTEMPLAQSMTPMIVGVAQLAISAMKARFSQSPVTRVITVQ